MECTAPVTYHNELVKRVPWPDCRPETGQAVTCGMLNIYDLWQRTILLHVLSHNALTSATPAWSFPLVEPERV